MLSWPKAAAAPWTLKRDAIYARTSLAGERVEDLEAWRGDVYAEYGVRDWLTASFKYETVMYPSASDFNADGWRATLRQRVFQTGAFNWTIETGLLEGAAIGGRNGCDTLGVEARTGVSWSGKWRNQERFAFAETVIREHEGCRRYRQEIGLGQRVTKNIWSITQVWLDRGSPNASSHKAQTELLWRQDRTDYSIGYRNENGGFFVEESIFVAIAKTF
ncbi:MAG: hypothetical protein NXH88_05915 [Hyphomonas sp.]|nr:hypothetical protein [Hyphomonas sp.]